MFKKTYRLGVDRQTLVRVDDNTEQARVGVDHHGLESVDLAPICLNQNLRSNAPSSCSRRRP